jgi:hypothetical protein
MFNADLELLIFELNPVYPWNISNLTEAIGPLAWRWCHEWGVPEHQLAREASRCAFELTVLVMINKSRIPPRRAIRWLRRRMRALMFGYWNQSDKFVRPIRGSRRLSRRYRNRYQAVYNIVRTALSPEPN